MSIQADILTDAGQRAFADKKIDIAIPFNQNEELKKTISEINIHLEKLIRLVDKVNNIYAHGYVTISVNSAPEEDA